MTKRNQILKDARLALTVLSIAFLLGLFVGRASACDSYEECIKDVKYFDRRDQDTWSDYWNRDLAIQKAIAYKLDEISKKLDK